MSENFALAFRSVGACEQFLTVGSRNAVCQDALSGRLCVLTVGIRSMGWM